MGTKSFDNYADLITFSRASSATYLDSDGLLKTATTNTPRIEYDADGNRLGLLIEEQRTNLFTQSNLSNWLTTGGASISTNYASSPENIQNAAALIASSSDCRAYRVKTLSGSGHTFSVYAKKGVNRYLMLRLNASGGQYRRYFDLQNGVLAGETGSGSASIQEVNDGWYRCSITTADTSASSQNVLLSSTNQDGTEAGSVTSGVGVYLYGAQLEAGSFPTSYIPTSGSTATRAADVASIPTSDFGYNQSAGSIVIESQTFDITDVGRNFSLSDGTSSNVIRSQAQATNHLIVINSGSVTANLDAGAYSNNVFSKLGGAFAKDDIAASMDGGAVVTDTSSSIPAITKLNIGGRYDGGLPLNGHIKSIKYYPRRLTNDQLQELTQ